MPCTESYGEGDASQSPSMTTPMKTNCNSGSGHGKQDTATESEEEEPDLEQQCYKAKGKSRKDPGWLEYEVQETWDTGQESTLERADIDNQILKRMTKFMTNRLAIAYYSRFQDINPKRLTFTFGSCTARNIIARDQMKPYEFNRCPMAYCCSCTARCRVCVWKDYIRLEFHGTHDETSHAEERSKNLKYKQIIAIHKAVIVAPNLSATK